MKPRESDESVERAELMLAPRLGLFGGSFDPVHLGHLHVARTALASFALDAVLFVPAARSPHKQSPTAASAEQRLAMLRLALEDEPRFGLSGFELERGAPSYTAVTIDELARRRASVPDAQLFLILGSDNLAGLGSWRDIDTILERATPIIVARRGAGLPALEAEHGLSAASIERLRAGFVDSELVDVAATELRESLARGEGEDQLPAPVWEYIRARGIYAAP